MTTTPKPPKRWTRWLLVGSLALNLLILGAVGGALVKGGPGGGPRFDLTSGPLARAMAPEDRDALRDILKDRNQREGFDRRSMREDMETLVSVLRADTFDAEGFRALLIRQRDRLQASQEVVVDAVTDYIASMSDEARAAFATRLEEQLRRGPPNRDGSRDN